MPKQMNHEEFTVAFCTALMGSASSNYKRFCDTFGEANVQMILDFLNEELTHDEGGIFMVGFSLGFNLAKDYCAD